MAVAPPNPQAAPGAPGQRQPQQKGGPGGTVPQTPASLQPGDEVVTEPPAQKIVNKKATFSGLDKITGRIINFDEDIGETVQFGALRVKTDACYTRPATEAANTDAFVEVDEITLQGEVKRIFSGWMYAASPGLHGVEHPIYDIWLTDCKEPQQTIATAAPDPPQPSRAPPPPAQKKAARRSRPCSSARRSPCRRSSSSSRRRHPRRRRAAAGPVRYPGFGVAKSPGSGRSAPSPIIAGDGDDLERACARDRFAG